MINTHTDFIPCSLIPLSENYLILPNTTVAEVIPLPDFSPIDDQKTYTVGRHHWKTEPLPIIDLESLVEQRPAQQVPANKLCILHSINPEIERTAYALLCHGAPQLIQINELAINIVTSKPASPYLHCRIKVGNKIAYIPNLDMIESAL